MYTQLLHLIHILLLLVNNVVGVHAVRMVDSLYCQCSAYDLVLILDDNKVFVFVFVFAQHATSSTAGLAFQNIGVLSRPQRKICYCNQKADT